MTTKTLAIGQVLFRWRSLTPVPVILLLGVVLWLERARWSAGDGTRALVFFAAGLVVALLGQALRAWVLGQVPEGTSGQGFSLEATTLNTNGPYARVRNPLYVGNLGIVVGLLLMTQSLLAAGIALLFFFGQYHFIIRAEEQFLRGNFGERFEEFCRKVPRWLPRLTPASDLPLSHRFDWRRALKKEHNPFTAWVTGALLIWAFQLWVRDPAALRVALPALLGAEGALLVCFVLVKAWKKGKLLRGEPPAAAAS